MARRRISSKPRRRSYTTGGDTIPELKDEIRPIPLTLDENGEIDESIRAFSVLIRNRSDTSVYVREGAEGDEFEVKRGEEYRIWENDGISRIFMRGQEGGEKVEIRTLEAHNDFEFTDKIDAFLRAFSHYVGTATSNTQITGQEIDLTIDDAEGLNVTGDVTADIQNEEIGVTGDVNANIVNESLDITGDVTADIQNEEIDVSGDVNADIQNDSLAVESDDTTFNVDEIQGQADFDLSTFGREGYTFSRFLQETSVDGDETNEWTLYEDADFDGSIESVTCHVYASNSGSVEKALDRVGFRVKIQRAGTDEWVQSSPMRAHSTHYANLYGGSDIDVRRFSSIRECAYTYTPNPGLYFEEGDSVRIDIQGDGTDDDLDDSVSYDIELNVEINQRVRA